MLILEDALESLSRTARALRPSILLLFFGSVFLLAMSSPEAVAREYFCNRISLCFKSEQPSFWNSIVFSLASGSLVSILFYWMLVRFPELRRRKRLKSVFLAQYKSFKLQCIDIFVVLSHGGGGLYEPGLNERLLDQVEFRKYFKAETGEGQNRWHRVLNNLNDYYLEALARKMEHFREDLNFFVRAVDIPDEDKVAAFNRLSQSTYYHVTRSDDYDEVKSLSQYLWQLFSGWSFIAGYSDDDPIVDLVSSV